MNVPILALCVISLSAPAMTAAASPMVTLRNLRAEVDIIPEARADIDVVVKARGGDTPPTVTTVGDKVTIEGDRQTGRRVYRVSYNLDRRMDVEAMRRRSHVDRPHDPDLMLITLRTPMKVKVKSNALVFGHVGPSQSVDINDSGDGEWRVDAVSQDLTVTGGGGADFFLSTSRTASIDLLGTGNVSLGDTDRLYVGHFGSGDITAGSVALDADLSISGVGDVTARAAFGRLRVLITDAGNLRVREGDLAKLTVRTIDGVGGVDFGGAVKDLDVDIGTRTQVHVHRVTGAVRKTTRQQAALVIDSP